MAVVASDLPRHSGLLLENCCMWRQPTCEKSSSRCQQEVLLFFPSDLKSSMVTPISDCLRHFLLFFPRTGSFEVTSLAINVSLGFWRSILYTFFNDSESQVGCPRLWLAQTLDFFQKKCMLSRQTFLNLRFWWHLCLFLM